MHVSGEDKEALRPQNQYIYVHTPVTFSHKQTNGHAVLFINYII